MIWTDERVAELRRLHTLNISARAIARQLGGFGHTPDGGRSAVLGKLHRLGLCKKHARRVPGLARKSKSVPSVPAAAKPIRKPPYFPCVPPMERAAHLEQIPPDKRKSITDLEPGDCRFPLGDPKRSEFSFCLQQAEPGLPYCIHHALRAYQQPLPAVMEIHSLPVREKARV